MILKVIKWALLYFYGVIEYVHVCLFNSMVVLDEHICMCVIVIEFTKYLFLTKVYKL